MKATALGLTAFLLAVALASGPDTLWVWTLDKGSDEYGTGIASRGSAIAVAGYFWGTNYNDDWLVARLNQDGDTVWTRTYDGGADEDAVGTCIDGESNILVAARGYSYGGQSSRLRFPDRSRPRSVFAKADFYFAITAKYDSLGELKWMRNDTNYAATGIACDSAGNCYVAGARIVDSMNWDTWLAKLSPSGDTVWFRTYNFAQFEVACGPAIDASGNLALCAYVGDLVDFDCLTVKLSPEGQVLWTSKYDRGPDDGGSGIAVDRSGNVVVAGRSSQDTTGQGFVLKYDSAGALVWEQVYPGVPTYGLTCDSAGDIYVAGTTGEYPGDCLTMKLDSMGTTLWTATYGGSYDDAAFSVVCDPYGNPVIMGSTTDSVTLNVDLLVVKYSALTGIAEPPRAGTTTAATHSIITTGPDFVLSVLSTDRYDVRLCDVTGRTRQHVFSGTLSTGAHRLSIAGQPAGHYVVTVTSPDGCVSRQRLVVVK